MKEFVRKMYSSAVVRSCLLFGFCGCCIAYQNIRQIGFGEYRNAIKYVSQPIVAGKKRIYHTDNEKHKDYSHSAYRGGELVFGKRGNEYTYCDKYHTYEKQRKEVAEKHRKLKLRVWYKHKEVKRV